MEFKKRYIICIIAITLLLSMATIYTAADINESLSSQFASHVTEDINNEI